MQTSQSPRPSSCAALLIQYSALRAFGSRLSEVATRSGALLPISTRCPTTLGVLAGVDPAPVRGRQLCSDYRMTPHSSSKVKLLPESRRAEHI